MNFVAMCLGGPYHGRTVAVPWHAAETELLHVAEYIPSLAVGVDPVDIRHAYRLELHGRAYYWIHQPGSAEVNAFSGLVRDQIAADKAQDVVTAAWCERNGARRHPDGKRWQWFPGGVPVEWHIVADSVTVGGWALLTTPTTHELRAMLYVLGGTKGGA